jgi:hypothetical protein
MRPLLCLLGLAALWIGHSRKNRQLAGLVGGIDRDIAG